MNTMYKEIVEIRKTPRIIGVLVLMCLMIMFSNLIENIKVFNFKIGFITDPLIILITVLFMAFEFLRCKVRYKYSIIADQLIIHKLKDRHQAIEENIKLKDIVFVGKAKELKKKLNISSSRYYICSLTRFNEYCCIYKDGNSYRKFYFQPSSNLIVKLTNIVNKKVASK
ncbi:hypothetical protein [Clostridium hydrogeniformans]|uniref:hypothetical protein n=1 Tax=Clostridium hydrogeniformans TaxID=349933 RepID=UPI00047F7AEF|nr:hypothetical protein [Clostridium hydrogeniformans]